jgi:AhpD family alkylhydroperoxidase
MNQVLICLQKNNGNIRLDLLDRRRQELVAIGNAIRAGCVDSISMHVEKALEAGASPKEIQKVVEYILGDGRLLNSISELLRALRFGEADRHGYISIVDDCREN